MHGFEHMGWALARHVRGLTDETLSIFPIGRDASRLLPMCGDRTAALERGHRSSWEVVLRPMDNIDYPLKLHRCEFGHDLVDGAGFADQQHRRRNRFRYFLFGRPFSPGLLRLHPPGTPRAYAAFKRIGGDFCSRDPRFTGHFWGSFAASHAISLMACAITLSLAQHRLPISLRRPSTLTDRHMPLGRSRGMPGWVLVRDHVAHSPAAVKQNPRVAFPRPFELGTGSKL